MKAIPSQIFLDLIGAPFVEGGRGPAEYDCLGLAIEIQRRLGKQVPAYLSQADELHRAVAAGGAFEEAHRLGEAEAGCVVLLRSPARAHGRHLGTMLDRYRMIHASESASAVVVEVLSRSLWGPRILGYYAIEDHA